MDKRTGRNIILIGFSTTGKSKVGQSVAKSLDWNFVDTDEEIAKRAGKEISEIFATDGEERFRELERIQLIRACGRERTVIATGGGAVLDPDNQQLMRQSGMLVCLEAEPDTVYQRLLNDTEGALRPLLEGNDPAQRIQQLKESRLPYYSIADWTVHTDFLGLAEVCHEVIRGWYYWSRAHIGGIEQKGELAAEVITAVEHYPIIIGWEMLTTLGARMKKAGLSGTTYIVSDETVSYIYGTRVQNCLENSGFAVNSMVVSPGETTKAMDTAVGIYDWLIENKAERNDIIIAFGGGMVGDLAGFVASTFLRGMLLVYVPTSLAAMVDASIGGKTAVNHPQAKNIIGTFYQPRLVLADVQTLTTLSQRELISGWAEVIKHGLILDTEFFEFVEKEAGQLAGLEPATTVRAIGKSAAIKAMIVSEDEKEKGRRTLLNYGHTIAHGLEAATNYERFLHGEAVAIGMMGAAMLSRKMGLLELDDIERQRELLERFGLPTSCSDIDIKAILKAMELDKKVRAKAIRWVLLDGIGNAVIRDNVPTETVIDVLDRLISD